jgi:hypothetical protein
MWFSGLFAALNATIYHCYWVSNQTCPQKDITKPGKKGKILEKP